jgi:hypothetical protein
MRQALLLKRVARKENIHTALKYEAGGGVGGVGMKSILFTP